MGTILIRSTAIWSQRAGQAEQYKRLFGQYWSGNDGQRSDAHCDQDVCSGGTGGISAPRSSSSSGAWNCTCHSFSSVSLIWN
jgi:hypothetical protein